MPRFRSIEDADHPRLPNVGFRMDARALQLVGDKSCSFVLLKTKLRVRMNPPSYLDEVILEGSRLVEKASRESEANDLRF